MASKQFAYYAPLVRDTLLSFRMPIRAQATTIRIELEAMDIFLNDDIKLRFLQAIKKDAPIIVTFIVRPT